MQRKNVNCRLHGNIIWESNMWMCRSFHRIIYDISSVSIRLSSEFEVNFWNLAKRFKKNRICRFSINWFGVNELSYAKVSEVESTGYVVQAEINGVGGGGEKRRRRRQKSMSEKKENKEEKEEEME